MKSLALLVVALAACSGNEAPSSVQQTFFAQFGAVQQLQAQAVQTHASLAPTNGTVDFNGSCPGGGTFASTGTYSGDGTITGPQASGHFIENVTLKFDLATRSFSITGTIDVDNKSYDVDWSYRG